MKSWKYTLSSDTSVFAMSAMVTVLQAHETFDLPCSRHPLQHTLDNFRTASDDIYLVMGALTENPLEYSARWSSIQNKLKQATIFPPS